MESAEHFTGSASRALGPRGKRDDNGAAIRNVICSATTIAAAGITMILYTELPMSVDTVFAESSILRVLMWNVYCRCFIPLQVQYHAGPEIVSGQRATFLHGKQLKRTLRIHHVL
jgi:hypothetical protein